MKCLISAWHKHEAEIRGWLIGSIGNTADADDLLQDVFEKAMLQGERFCKIDNARAWLFRVARNTLIDSYRMKHDQVELPDNISIDEPQSDEVDNLSECLPRVLSELSADDREVMKLCDLDGMSQQHFADLKGISLSATKSRIQRARRKLRQTLEANCKVRFSEAGSVCCFVPRSPLK